MTIPDKATFKRLSARGLLGNTFRVWDTPAQVAQDGYRGWLTIRARQASDRLLFVPAVPVNRLYLTGGLNEILCVAYLGYGDYSARVADIYLQEIPDPDTERIINLEAMRDPGMGLCLRYALNDPQNLRHSLERNGRDLTGVCAWRVLETYLAEDLDVLRDIWDRFPDAVIEASRFSMPVGVLQQQTICWEVRCY